MTATPASHVLLSMYRFIALSPAHRCTIRAERIRCADTARLVLHSLLLLAHSVVTVLLASFHLTERRAANRAHTRWCKTSVCCQGRLDTTRCSRGKFCYFISYMHSSTEGGMGCWCGLNV